jgi:hypothetical protein
MATVLAACNSNTSSDTKSKEAQTDSAMTENSASKGMGTSKSNLSAEFPIREVIAGYLQLKNALTKDNAKDAAAAGKSIVAVLEKVDKASLPADKMKAYADLQDDLKENAEHIGDNAGKIDHQREHFEMLSKDMADLIKIFGNGGQTLYRDFCPMANDGKGATWISEVQEIKNPYMGSKMPTCGSLKETIK